jgi:hypothetical protein
MLADVRSLIIGKELARAWLLITTDEQRFTLRLGKEPFYWLRDNIATTNKWFEVIQGLRASGTEGV